MNEEGMSFKVHRPKHYLRLRPVTVRELHINTFSSPVFSKLSQGFTTLQKHPLDLGAALSTLQSPDARLVGLPSPVIQSENSS